MKKTLTIFLAVLLAVAMFAGCAAAPAAPAAPAAEDSLQKVKDKGYFILGLDDSFPPMGYRDENDEIVGFDIDLAKECAKKMGVEVKLQPLVWDNIAEELNGNKVDVIWNGCTITDERKEKFEFCKPYLLNTQIVAVLADSPYQTLADLNGKIAGIQAGSSANIALDGNPDFKNSLSDVRSYDKNDKAMLDLAAKRIDCVVVDSCVYGYYIQKKAGVYRMLEQDIGAEEFGVATRKGDKSFRDALQKALDECMAEGITAGIAEKWFGSTSVLPK